MSETTTTITDTTRQIKVAIA